MFWRRSVHFNLQHKGKSQTSHILAQSAFSQYLTLLMLSIQWHLLKLPPPQTKWKLNRRKIVKSSLNLQSSFLGHSWGGWSHRTWWWSWEDQVQPQCWSPCSSDQIFLELELLIDGGKGCWCDNFLIWSKVIIKSQYHSDIFWKRWTARIVSVFKLTPHTHSPALPWTMMTNLMP